jgi:murein DD-endopeptidase MepM/ murein hydrolase activator NlpD
LYQRNEFGFGLSGSTGALSLDQAIDFLPPRESFSERLMQYRDKARDIDWVPDLGSEIGSLSWFRGAATCLALCGSAIALAPGLEPLAGVVADPLSGDAWEEARAQTIAPLAWGADTGRRMAANDLVVPLANTPERPTIDVTATLGQGDGFARVLERNGVGGTEARKVAAMVAGVTSLGAIEPGTIMSMTLGARPSKDMPRPLEFLAFRARFDMKLAIRRSGGVLALQRLPIAIDNTPLRVRGTVGNGLYLSARAAGVPAKAVEAYIRALASKDMLNTAMRRGASFDIIVEQARAETGEVQTGKLLYAGLESDGRQARLLQWTIGGRTEWFEASGVGQKRAGMTQPVSGARMSSGFGMRTHPVLGYSRFHKGIDFAAVHGTPIRAVTDGLVAFAGRNAGYGNHVRLTHSGALGTSYSHMSRIAVAPGARVAQGQVIGYVGSTGLSTGPHLHFEVYRNGATVNPRSVSFESRSLLSGQELALFRARLNAMLSIPASGGAVRAAGVADGTPGSPAGAQRLSR